MLLIGMVHPSFIPQDARKRAAEVQQIRRDLQEKFQKEYEKVGLNLKMRVGTLYERFPDESLYQKYKSKLVCCDRFAKSSD